MSDELETGSERLVRAETLASASLKNVRANLVAEFQGLDNCGADAVMLRVLLNRAGRLRYNRTTLKWLIDASYAEGFDPHTLKFFEEKAWEDSRGYSPFRHYHDQIPEVDEDYCDPPPPEQRPLRFLECDLQQWENELCKCSKETLALLKGLEPEGL